MTMVNVQDAEAHFAKLLAQVEAGEEVVIERAGRPVAKLVKTAAPQRRPRVLGLDRGKIWIADDFDAPIPEFEDPL